MSEPPIDPPVNARWDRISERVFDLTEKELLDEVKQESTDLYDKFIHDLRQDYAEWLYWQNDEK